MTNSAVLASHFDENVGVETAFSARTLPYFDADANDTLSDVGSVSIMKIADPASILDMKFLPELLDHVSVLGQARMNFVSELLKFEKTVANIKVLKEAGDEYSRRLNERIFSQAGSTRVEVTLTLATLALGIVGGAYLAGPLGSVGLPCLLWIADRYLPMRVTKPLLNKSVFEFAFDQPRNARVGKLAIAASRLDPEFVDRHIGSIERTGSPIHVAAKHADRAGPAGRAVDA